MATLLEFIVIDFTPCEAKLNEVKREIVKMEALLADDKDSVSDDEQLETRSLNVRLVDEDKKPLMANKKQVSALVSIKMTDTIESLSKDKFVLVETKTKKGKDIAFYVRDNSAGVCVARAWTE